MNVDQIIETASKRSDRAVGTRLRAGDIIRLSGQEYLIWLVNECRACAIPLLQDHITFEDVRTGKQVSFQAQAKMVSISPNSEVEILRRLGKSGMIEFLEQQKHNKQKRKEMKANKTEKTEETPKLGKLGGFLGHSLTSVIRAMGKAKWAYWEARHVFDAEKIPVAENTIRIQLSAGARGTGGDPAPIEAELKKLRPDESEKPARANSTEGKAEKKSGKKADKKADKKAGKAEKKSGKKADKKAGKPEPENEPDDVDPEDAAE